MKTHFVYGSPAHPVEHTHAPFLQSAFFPHLPSHGTVKHIHHNIIFQKPDQKTTDRIQNFHVSEFVFKEEWDTSIV